MSTTAVDRLIRVESPAIVEKIAEANHVPATVSSHAAAVDLPGVTYFWTAA